MEGISTPTPLMTQDPVQLRQIMESDRLSEEQKLEQASGVFEAMLLKQFLKDAMRPMFGGGALGGGGSTSQHYQDLIVDTLASSLSQEGGFGLSSVIQSELQGRTPVNMEETNGRVEHGD